MLRTTSRASIRLSLVAAAVAAAFCVAPLHAQTQQRPAGRGQTTQPAQPARRPATQKPAAPTAKPPAAPAPIQQAAPPAPPPPPAAQDLRFKTIYTTADQKTESVSYQKGQRQRFEFADMLVLKQND